MSNYQIMLYDHQGSSVALKEAVCGTLGDACRHATLFACGVNADDEAEERTLRYKVFIGGEMFHSGEVRPETFGLWSGETLM